MKNTVFGLLLHKKMVNLHYKTWLCLLNKSLEYQFLFRSWSTKVTYKSANLSYRWYISLSGVHALSVFKKTCHYLHFNCCGFCLVLFFLLILHLGRSLKELEQPLSALGVKNGCKVMLIGKRVSVAFGLFFFFYLKLMLFLPVIQLLNTETGYSINLLLYTNPQSWVQSHVVLQITAVYTFLKWHYYDIIDWLCLILLTNFCLIYCFSVLMNLLWTVDLVYSSVFLGGGAGSCSYWVCCIISSRRLVAGFAK